MVVLLLRACECVYERNAPVVSKETWRWDIVENRDGGREGIGGRGSGYVVYVPFSRRIYLHAHCLLATTPIFRCQSMMGGNKKGKNRQNPPPSHSPPPPTHHTTLPACLDQAIQPSSAGKRHRSPSSQESPACRLRVCVRAHARTHAQQEKKP